MFAHNDRKEILYLAIIMIVLNFFKTRKLHKHFTMSSIIQFLFK